MSLTTQKYRMPPKAIADLVDAPLLPSVNISPKQNWLLLMEMPNLPPISELAQPELRLAGLRINPRTNGPSRSSYFTKLTLKRISDGREIPIIGLPEEPRISNVSWSPDGERIAFTQTNNTVIELWVAEVNSGKAIQLTTGLNHSAVYDSPFYWLSDSRNLLCKVIPNNRGAAPEAPEVPSGPVIQENIGKKAPARTYQDLLTNPHHELLFEYYFTSQILRLTVEGENTPIGSEGIIRKAEPSPDGKYILVVTNHRPFSYLVPMDRFPERVEIWDLDGNVVREIVDLPLAEEVPIDFDATRTGPRSDGVPMYQQHSTG